MDAGNGKRPYTRTSLYAKAAENIKLRDKRAERLARRVREVPPWLQPGDHPVCRAWAELEILCETAYAMLRADGLINAQGEPRRMLTDYRQLRQCQLQFATALGMTPASRAALKLDGRGQPLDLVSMLAAHGDANDGHGDERFGVLYLGFTLKGCFVEAILRDRRNGAVGDYPIGEAELFQRRYAEIVVTSSLSLVDLRGDGRIRMGIPSDVVGSTRQARARAWSVAFYDHPAARDGIIYSSRLNEETNLAVSDRAIAKLSVDRSFSLIRAPGFASVLHALMWL
jgi:hypothetical protein